MTKRKDFQELQKYWDDQLKKSGFIDIENRKNGALKGDNSKNYLLRQFNSTRYENRARYFEMAKELLETGSFKNELHKKIWELHSDGFSEKQISKKVTTKKKSMVHVIISKYSKLIKN